MGSIKTCGYRWSLEIAHRRRSGLSGRSACDSLPATRSQDGPEVNAYHVVLGDVVVPGARLPLVPDGGGADLLADPTLGVPRMSRRLLAGLLAAVLGAVIYRAKAPVRSWLAGQEPTSFTTEWELVGDGGPVPGLDQRVLVGEVDGSMCLVLREECFYDLAEWRDRSFGPSATVASFAIGEYAVSLVSRPLYTESVLIGDLIFQDVVAEQRSNPSGGTPSRARQLVLGVQPLTSYVCLAEGPIGWEWGRRQVAAVPVERPGTNGVRVFKASSPVTIQTLDPKVLGHCADLMGTAPERVGAVAGPG